MKISSRLVGVFAGSIALLVASTARADEFPRPSVDYSADLMMKVSTARGPVTMNGRIFSSGMRERREVSMMGRSSVMISDLGERRVWILIPEQKMYLEQRGGNRDQGGDPSGSWHGADVELTELGKSSVNGVPCTKYQVSVKASGGITSAGFAWLDEHDIPVRMEGSSKAGGQETTFEIDYRNLEIAPQDKSLFEIPAGYTKLETGGPAGMSGIPGAGKPGGQMDSEELRKMREEMMKRAEEMQQR